ncbi:MAG TPA: hypothetical protein VK035_08180 [Kiloniellales bacterium]|nr:hypothetical protein [Kiloniellales bacterium]
MNSFFLVTLHLLAAIAFVGAVFFEVFVIEALREPLGRGPMRLLEIEVGRRLRRLMPFVLAVLYGAGIAMAWGYRDVLARPLDSSFATLLSLKILLAVSVLLHFITAITLGARGRLRSRQVRIIHRSVVTHLLLIVVLAKAMFAISW